MTKTTHSRQIKMIVDSIFNHNGVDIDSKEWIVPTKEQITLLHFQLCGATQAYVVGALEEKRDKVELREAILNDMQIAADNITQIEAMQGRVKKSLGFEPNGRHDDLIQFLIRKDKKGETIELFRTWWDNQNEYKRPALWKFDTQPDFLMSQWPSAFSEHSVQSSGNQIHAL